MNANKTFFPSSLRAIPLSIMALSTLSLAYGANNIPDTPLQANTFAEPNIVLILDDSGSMQFEVMPESSLVYFTFPRANPLYGANWGYGTNFDTVARFNETNRYARYFRTAQYNTLYYNPRTRYQPWLNSDGSRMLNSAATAACHNPNKCPTLTPGSTSEGTLDLTHDQTWNVPWRNDDGGESKTTRTFYPATFFTYTGATKLTGPNDANNTEATFTKTEIKSGKNYVYPNAPKRTDCALNNGTATCTYDQEIQNFANWYTYYRSRILTARAGIGAAFAEQGEKLRVGFAAINKGQTNIDGENRSTLISGVRPFSGTSRTAFFDALYGHTMPSAGTPLRKALDDIGKYYTQTDEKGPWSSTPGETGGSLLACRQSYSILMTDGYWNSDAASGSADNDNDSSAIAEITGPNGRKFSQTARSPFKDDRAHTLADVAAYYWKTDLANFENVVPTSVRDPAFWQHMVTFGVGFGVTGKQDPIQAFNAIDNQSINITWDDPLPDANETAKIDDLLHAAVNSRGDFLSAKEPDEFAKAMKAMLDNITQRQSSASSVSTNSTKLTTSSLVFSANFNTNKWTGELEAYAVSDSGVATTPSWKASEKIPAHNLRKIFTTSGGAAKEFLWNNLSSTDQTALVNSDILAFTRGDRSKEVQNGGTLRTRGSLLGDIVNSSPAYAKDSKLVLVGANDGMLHGFSADTGVELFAYIPSPVLANLVQLSQTNYGHKYFVDGEISVGEKSQTFLTKSYAVATLGRGGKGLVALDITAPASFGATNVAWEYVSTTDKDLGYMLGKPIIARMNDDSTVAIVGNGYNSTDGKAVLYIINLETGAVRKISTGVAGDNGLATPGVYDANADGYVDYIYAGDLKGNVWKFDVTDSKDTQWKVANNGAAQFVAKDAAGNLQPITSQITMAKNFLRNDPNLGKLFLFFGTGAYFRSDDPANKAVQSWYAVVDDGTTIAGRNYLKPRGLSSVFTVEGKTVRSFLPAIIQFDKDGKLLSHDMTGWKGWYIDWMDPPTNTKRGERIVTPSAFYRFNEPVLLVSSIVPIADDPCQPGGTGYLNAVNAFTGGSLSESFFLFSSYSGSAAIGSLDMDIGMVSQAAIFTGDASTGQLVVGGSGKPNSQDAIRPKNQRVNTGVQPRGRLSWREIIRK